MDEREETEPGFVLEAAVLHCLDYTHGMMNLSEETLQIEDSFLEKFVTRYVRKAMHDIRCRTGYFEEGSEFCGIVEDYKKEEMNFLAFTRQAAECFDAFVNNIAIHSYDLLFARFMEEQVPYVAMIVLENQEVYVHSSLLNDSGKMKNGISMETVLPSFTKKIDTFALVNLLNNEIRFVDETKWNSGEVNVLADMVLGCTSEKSGGEVIQEVSAIAEEIAVQFDENPSLLLPKVKQYIRKAGTEEKPLVLKEAAEEIFEDDQMVSAFLARSEEKELPEEVVIPKKAVERKMKNQRIRTDTGIELSFPVDYYENPEYIRFVNEPDGTISITIQHIGKIMPKG